MESEAGQGQNYGEGFRKEVSKLVDEVKKLDFLPPAVKESVGFNADRLCLVEAKAERTAFDLAKRARDEWDTKYAKDAHELFNQVSEFSRAQVKTMREFLDRL